MEIWKYYSFIQKLSVLPLPPNYKISHTFFSEMEILHI